MKTLTASLAALVLAAAASAAELTADAIVSKANDAAYYAGADGQAKVTMTMSDGRERVFVILRKNTTGKDQSFYVYFEAPADVRKMSYLVWKHPDGDDDRWLYLPSLNLVKRIAPGDKRTSFVGSDFLYEDVSGRGLDEDTHELVETTDTRYVINNTPKDAASVEFASYKVWIDKDTFLPRKAEYLDRNGKVYRRVEGVKVETIQGYPTVTESFAEDLNTGSKTVNVFSDIRYDIGLNEQIFTERFLRRPPREVLK
jgi:hypothetical protein